MIEGGKRMTTLFKIGDNQINTFEPMMLLPLTAAPYMGYTAVKTLATADMKDYKNLWDRYQKADHNLTHDKDGSFNPIKFGFWTAMGPMRGMQAWKDANNQFQNYEAPSDKPQAASRRLTTPGEPPVQTATPYPTSKRKPARVTQGSRPIDLAYR
jgi:hypothetical protein